MLKRHRNVVVATVAALAAIAGGGAALAASGTGTPEEESKAVIDAAADELGVTPARLSDALKTALEGRVDAAVAAGRLTEAQGEELKARIETGEVPLVGLGHGPGHGHGLFVHLGGLEAAAEYLGTTTADLRTALEGGKTLAQLAEDAGKTVDGLIQALTDDAAQKLDEAVADGRLTESQRTAMLADLKQRITNLVNGTLPGPPPGGVLGVAHDTFGTAA